MFAQALGISMDGPVPEMDASVCADKADVHTCVKTCLGGAPCVKCWGGADVHLVNGVLPEMSHPDAIEGCANCPRYLQVCEETMKKPEAAAAMMGLLRGSGTHDGEGDGDSGTNLEALVGGLVMEQQGAGHAPASPPPTRLRR